MVSWAGLLIVAIEKEDEFWNVLKEFTWLSNNVALKNEETAERIIPVFAPVAMLFANKGDTRDWEFTVANSILYLLNTHRSIK